LLGVLALGMPWIDLISPQDWASIWYMCNSNTGQASAFDPAKQTILLLHPAFLDSTWIRAQWDDVTLSENYNLIAPDLRCHGKTRSVPSGYHDIWVEAADLAHLHHVSIANLPTSLHVRQQLRLAFHERASDCNYHPSMFLLLKPWQPIAP
jgi:hypothetical protein